jgi:hypothetical protein
MTDQTPDEVAVVQGDYFAGCERCGWTATGERGAVIRAGMAHECPPAVPASDGQPPVDSETSPEGAVL